MSWCALREKTCGVAVFSFRGTEVLPPHGIDIDLGDIVYIIEECGEWYRGCVKTRRNAVGVFPASYVKLKPAPASLPTSTVPTSTRTSANVGHGGVTSSCSPISRTSAGSSDRDSGTRQDKDNREKERRESTQPQQNNEDAVTDEIVKVVREWKDIWQRIFVENGSHVYQFDVIHRRIRELVDGRKQLITGTLTKDQMGELKSKLTKMIDWVNRRLGLDLVPRKGCVKADPDKLGAVELYKTHVRTVENADAIRGSGTQRKKRVPVRSANCRTLSYHLLLSVRDFAYQLNDDCEIYFSLFDATRSQFITERFMVKFKIGTSNFVDNLQCQGLTVFEDLGYSDLSKDLYLIVQVVRIGRMFYSESSSHKKSSHFYKRPFAGGVLNIGDVVNPNVTKNEAAPSVILDGGSHYHQDGDADGDLHSFAATSNSFLDEEREFPFKLYSCDEKDFWQLHDLLIKKHMSKVSLLSGSNSVVVTLKLLSGDLNHIRLENPVAFTSKAIINSASSLVITKKLGFPDVIMPGDVRNDMYLILESGEFEKSGKTTGKNIEVTIMVFDMSVGPINDKSGGRSLMPPASYIHVSNGTGLVDEYQSVILYHHSCPKWHETIRFSIPIEKFPFCHVRVEYRHCSTKEKNDKKLFGFSFVKLMDEEGTTLKDGAHELYVYKCEDKNKLRDPCSYLSLPSFNTNLSATINASKDSLPSKDHKEHRDSKDSGHSWSSKDRNSKEAEVIGNQLFQRSAKEILNLSTLLVSTKLTQNMDLVSLLKWKQHPEKVRETLMSVAGHLSLSGEEIVKFLQDVLDVLFSMFLSEEGESNDFSGNVFVVLVNIFSMLEDPKFEHFKPVIDQYINDHFSAALVYKGLLTSVTHYARVVHLAPKLSYQQIQRCFETGEYTFKFIIRSHVLFTRASGGEVNDSIVRDVQDLFQGLTELIAPGSTFEVPSSIEVPAASAAEVVPIQSAMLYNLSKMYTQLMHVLSPLDITRLLVDLFSKIKLKESTHPLSPAKLTALLHLVDSQLFTDHESRRLILPEICKHIRHHLDLREELKLCTEVLGEILTFLHRKRDAHPIAVHDDIEIVATTTLDKLVQCVLVLERRSAIVGDLVACMVGLLELMDHLHYNRLWDGFGERHSLKELLLRIFLVFRDLVRQDVYPPDWRTMKLETDSIILHSLAELSQPLIENFLHKFCFDHALWNQFFTLATAFLTQPGLQLERFREEKCDEIRSRYGDMRLQMGQLILNMWAELGENKASFIPAMVGPFLEITLVPEEELRNATLYLFYDMLDVEQTKYGNFKQVECELIDKLDMLISENKGDDEYRQLFNRILLKRIEDYDPPWKPAGIAFVKAVTRLLERLLDYRNVLQGDENRDKRMSTTVNLLNFYHSEVNRREMYLRYIYKLHDLHRSAENYIEAGFTLVLHSQMLSWSPSTEKLSTEYGYPAQTELERKEMIYVKIIDYFDRGKLWENGIPFCKELAEIYETQLLDYTKLSELLKKQASFFENILQQLRPEPEYFRVGFFGKGFPPFVRNKEFIYRGSEYERIGAFIQRILVEWPDAEVLKNSPPDDSILNSTCKYVQICSAKPQPNTKHDIRFTNAAQHGREIAEPIKSYYQVNNVSTFVYDRRLTKGVQEEESDNEFKHMWIERSTMTTSAHLPGILRWFEVVEKQIEELTPVRFAYEKMDDINGQLSVLVEQYVKDPKRNVNPLSMRLQGMLDAAVMGGLPKYRDAFFTAEFINNSDPDSVGYVSKLYSAILEQVSILEQALGIHGKLIPKEVQPLHNRLLQCFTQMKETLNKDFNHSPATKGKLVREDSQRDSFRKTTSGSSIVYTPLPPVPRQPVKKHSLSIEHTTNLSNRSSTSSSGYGHLIGSIFDDHQEQIQSPPPPPVTVTSNATVHRPLQHHNNSDEDDEDFYAKPDESKINQLLAQYGNTNNAHVISSDRVDSMNSVSRTPPPGASPNVAAPPIPNRSSKRHYPAHITNSNASTISMTSINSASPTPAPALNEYILMPPSQIRELSANAAAAAAAAAAMAATDIPGAPADNFCSSISAVTNESYFAMPDACMGPPLPPKSTGVNNGSNGQQGDTSNPPQLPKRHPKYDTTKSPLTTKSSFTSNASRSSTPPSTQASSNNHPLPPTPTKTPPPVPPKPRSNSINNIAGSLEDYELLPPCASPSSPSYEDRLEQCTVKVVNGATQPIGATGNGTVKMREQTNSNNNGNGNIDGLTAEGNNTNGNSNLRISSTSTASSGSGGGGGVERRRTNKEYYELPIMNKERGKPTSTSANYVNNLAANSNTTTMTTDSNLNPEAVVETETDSTGPAAQDSAPV